MITIKQNLETQKFISLEEAMSRANELGGYVTIQFNGMEVARKFAVDGIFDGKFSNGETYFWKKRRRQ